MFQTINLDNKDGPQIDFEALKEKTFIDLSEKIERPETLISIGEHPYKGEFYPTSVMTAGEFSMIVAPSKTKKSFIKSAISGAFLGGNSKQYFDNIRGHRSSDDISILDFDTEQSRFYAHRTFRRALDIAGLEKYDRYLPYMLRTLNPTERVKFIEHMIYETPNLKLVFIDGVADLVHDTNDLVESMTLASDLLRWTEEAKVHVCVIMHSAYGTDKATGHLGSTLIKKAESVILLKPTDDTKKVIQTHHQYSRGYAFDDFFFSIKDKDAMPYKVDDITHDFPTVEGDIVDMPFNPADYKQVSLTDAFDGSEDSEVDVPF